MNAPAFPLLSHLQGSWSGQMTRLWDLEFDRDSEILESRIKNPGGMLGRCKRQ